MSLVGCGPSKMNGGLSGGSILLAHYRHSASNPTMAHEY
jgi:hypothetical protein